MKHKTQLTHGKAKNLNEQKVHSRARVQWSLGKFSCSSIINISRIKSTDILADDGYYYSFFRTAAPPRGRSKTAPKNLLLNDVHLNKMKEEQRVQWKRSANSALLEFLTWYYTPKDKKPQGFRSSELKLEWVSTTQIFQHEASTRLLTHSPSQTGLITTELNQVFIIVSYFPSTPWIPLPGTQTGSSQKHLCSAVSQGRLCDAGYQPHSNTSSSKRDSDWGEICNEF